ncbi:hypothetical protein K7640_23935 [Micromonospora sp. PLK6-60]|uniref:hypothetical protein n=1 Tax=Micromonospora sp. PLK6-60 TaxID=2873383 RepID=UPI001CA5FE4C|nr:hypothetical protein [Micromonospora sp. PLK6-60]MBY8874883.1 hypothetical protein [Micromonospora sp. PLK6-60]
MSGRGDHGDAARELPLVGDDLLLDALGRGEPAPAGDDVAALLAAWRTDLDADAPGLTGGTAPPAGPIRPGTPAELTEHATPPAGAHRPGTPAELTEHAAPPAEAHRPGTPLAPRRGVVTPLPARRRAVRLAAAAVAGVLLLTGLAVGSRSAGPTSPLWSLTKVLYPQQAEVRGVERLVAQARAAVAAGRYDEARRLADRAGAALAGIDDPDEVARLRADIDAVRRGLAARPAPPVGTAPSASPAAGPSAAARPPVARTTAPAPRGSGSAPAPTGSPTAAAPTPSPDDRLLPLPELPLPLPTGSLLSPLPGLPLPSIDLLD